ncbi:MAG: hypothetical protein ACXWQE_08395 [Bdellovibrionales bacterium]
MKKVLFCSVVFALVAQNSFAMTTACKKLVSEKANLDINNQAADDCFQVYFQVSKSDPNVAYVGINCDHVGNYRYTAETLPKGNTCKIVSLSSVEK